MDIQHCEGMGGNGRAGYVRYRANCIIQAEIYKLWKAPIMILSDPDTLH